ncbi:Hypothetical predicted protein [Xyrichtys novacula]|uniref:Uncharacterized protein n=1 Tax=Xyrichtys novacula TaxID=13765 RepID=A0AAV1FDX7_XYRNO|nr:Hypothetical predicted protein [Xyrichtys novacula]
MLLEARETTSSRPSDDGGFFFDLAWSSVRNGKLSSVTKARQINQIMRKTKSRYWTMRKPGLCFITSL